MSRSAPYRDSRTSSTILAALAIAAAACASDADAPAPVDVDSAGGASTPADQAPDASRVVTSLDTADGARVIFVDEGDGDAIGVEILSSTTTPATDALIEQTPSALELYMAIAPAGKAPLALVRDHARSSAAPPRHLAVAAATGETTGEYYNCADTTSWANDFKAWAPVLDGEYIASSAESGATTGYVSYSPTFYFDVCRPADLVYQPTDYWTSVQRRTSSSGTWSTISTNVNALDWQYRRWRYYRTSLTCSSYQYQLVVNSFTANQYRRAARWADPWSCQIGL